MNYYRNLGSIYLKEDTKNKHNEIVAKMIYITEDKIREEKVVQKSLNEIN